VCSRRAKQEKEEEEEGEAAEEEEEVEKKKEGLEMQSSNIKGRKQKPALLTST
jgi:hypothetical protein